MASQQMSEPRAFKVALIYMVEERTKKQVADLYEQLQTSNIKVFMFSKDMSAIESHVAAMEEEIRNADSVIICYSDNFKKKKGYRHREVRIALDEQKNTPPGYTYLITVCLEECQVPRYLSQARVLHYFQRDHFEGIMRWGLLVQREKLIEDGEKIQEFDYYLPQQEYLTEDTMLRGDVPLPPSSAESLGVWNVPYRRNPYFTGRDDLLERLDQHFRPRGQNDAVSTGRVALTQPQAIKGLGGIGKTQIAIEYAYRSQERGRYTHTFWVNAATEEALLIDFVQLVELLPTFTAKGETDQQKLVAAIKHWLEQCQERWLMIFDNADDIAVVRAYLPKLGNGSILLTTRADAVSSVATSIGVDTLGWLEGAWFLLRRAHRFERASDEEINQAGNIVVALDHFPLALDQAGAYLEETQCSFVDYLALYRTHRQALLAKRGMPSTDYPHSVATTWLISFQKVQQANPAAAELLGLCSFLAPDHILEELLRDGAAYWPAPLQQAVADPLMFQQLIADLLKFSLIKRLVEEYAFSIHRLVQAVQRDRMEPETQRQWAERAIRATNVVFPGDPQDPATWSQCLRYLNQVQVCNTLIEHYGLVFVEAASILSRAGLYLYGQASYSVTEPLWERALAIREQQLGIEHPDTAGSLNNLGGLYERQGRYAEAESLYQRALAIATEVSGIEHPEVAIYLNNLAMFYQGQSNYTKAEPLYLRALSIREQQLGTEHLETAISLNNLAYLYERQGNYAKAEPLHQRVLAIRKQQLGNEHLDTATSLNNVGMLYRTLGKYAEAEPVLKQALAIREQQLGTEHPYITQSLNYLAGLYEDQGKYSEAESLYRRALAIATKSSGIEHPEVATYLNNLAMLYRTQGKYAEAEPLLQQALAIREQQLGIMHPDTAVILNSLARLYNAQGKYTEAESLYRRALTIATEAYSVEHPEVATYFNNLAKLYENQGKYSEAEPLYQCALAIVTKTNDVEHPEMATYLNNLARLYERQSNYSQAEPLYQRALAIREQQLGTEHPDTADSLNNLASLYYMQGRYAEVEPLYQRALAICEHVLGQRHPNTQAARENLVFFLQTMGRNEDAKKLEESS